MITSLIILILLSNLTDQPWWMNILLVFLWLIDWAITPRFVQRYLRNMSEEDEKRSLDR